MCSANIVYGRLGNQRTALTAAVDDSITLTFDPFKTHVFDPATEHVRTSRG
jgi:hypothetical protein